VKCAITDGNAIATTVVVTFATIDTTTFDTTKLRMSGTSQGAA
jgi:hypothetical protein